MSVSRVYCNTTQLAAWLLVSSWTVANVRLRTRTNAACMPEEDASYECTHATATVIVRGRARNEKRTLAGKKNKQIAAWAPDVQPPQLLPSMEGFHFSLFTTALFWTRNRLSANCSVGARGIASPLL